MNSPLKEIDFHFFLPKLTKVFSQLLSGSVVFPEQLNEPPPPPSNVYLEVCLFYGIESRHVQPNF